VNRNALALLLVLLVLRIPRKFIQKAAIVELATALGFPDPNLAAAIAMAESGGDANAIGDFGHSFGLWQIHTPKHPKYSGQKLLDPTYNGQAAFEISKSGTDWSPWTAYKNGAFRKYM
jgi:hypothetical protein